MESMLNNYDLSHKVNKANGKMNVKSTLLDEVDYSVFLYSVYILLDAVSRREDGIRWLHHAYVTSGVVAVKLIIITLFEKIFFNKRIKRNACSDLKDLLVDLKEDLGIETSLELLKRAEVTKVKYNPIIVRGKPTLHQNKFISIPAYKKVEDTSNLPTNVVWRNEENVSVLQEHNIMHCKKYKLSIVDSNKELK